MADHDLLQRGPMMRRLVVSLFIGVTVGAVIWTIMSVVIEPEASTKAGDWRYGAWNALYYFTGFGACAAYMASHILLKRRDDRRWAEPARAQALESKED